jgi:hypothetical protein
VGEKNLKGFSNYFQCNAPNDKFRPSPVSQFANYHGDHFQEWNVFEFARNLDEEAAMKSISMGLAQIMGFNYDTSNDSPSGICSSESSKQRPSDALDSALRCSSMVLTFG